MPGTTVDRPLGSSSARGRGYDNGMPQSFHFAAIDFGTIPALDSIPVPTGMKYCRVQNITLHNVTEAFPALTTLPSAVLMGIAADTNKYVDARWVSISTTDSADFADCSIEPIIQALIDLSADGDDISQIEVTWQANTGGTPAGIADVTINVEWF